CTLKGTSQINGKKIEWIRDADNATNGTTGAWRCKTDVAENLRPKSCGAS
ncbi:pilin, partial [Acinetobacter baumannii]